MEVIVAIVNPAGVAILLFVATHKSPGISYDGGYADYVIALPTEALAIIPDRLSGVIIGVRLL